MGKSKDGNVTCLMYTQMRIVGLGKGFRCPVSLQQTGLDPTLTLVANSG